MIIRFSTSRIILVSLGTLLVLFFVLRLLSSASHSSETDEVKLLPSAVLNKQSPVASSAFKDTPMFDEHAELFVPARISPTELYQPGWKRQYVSKKLTYNDKAFRQSAAPILWLDERGDVRWNAAAEHGMINYLTNKQFPQLEQLKNRSSSSTDVLTTCRGQSMFLMYQHWSGFFSRVLCFIAQFGQTLYTPRIGVLSGTRFGGGRGETDDFLDQGVKRYFLPTSICTAYEEAAGMKDLRDRINSRHGVLHIRSTAHLLELRNNTEDHALWSDEFWKLDYHHVPIRKWLFDRKQSSVAYDSPVSVLIDHADEHIYAPKNELSVPIGDWVNTNKPDAFSSDLVQQVRNDSLTWRDHVFGSFLRYMFVLFFGSRNAPRIEFGTRLLTQHWRSYLTDRYGAPSGGNVFNKLAGLYIRRGDKSVEDSFWAKHQRWRNLSLYVKGIVDEEKRQKTKFDYIFVMTDDTSVMESLQDYTNPDSKGKDEPYAREHLRGREILYNVLAPQPCFDPFRRIGFEQFLVSMRFLIEQSVFTVGHTDSNVFRFFREVVYAQRQLRPDVQTYTYVRNAPDSLDADTMIKAGVK